MATRQPSKHMAYHELREALGEPGCCVCRLAEQALKRYLESLLWESVNDPGVRQRLLAARGFCREHSRQVESLGSRLAVAILWRDLLAQEVAELQRSGGATRRRNAAAAELCPACEQRAAAERHSLETLVEHLEAGGLRAEYMSSAGLCLVHLEGALAGAAAETRRFLVESETEKLNRLIGELSEIIRKHDHRFRHEPWGAERDAWARATRKLKGEAAHA